MRTQQLFHLQKALVLHSGDGGEVGGGGSDKVQSGAVISMKFRGLRHRCLSKTNVHDGAQLRESIM